MRASARVSGLARLELLAPERHFLVVLAVKPTERHLYWFRQSLQQGAAAHLQMTNATEAVGGALLHGRETITAATADYNRHSGPQRFPTPAVRISLEFVYRSPSKITARSPMGGQRRRCRGVAQREVLSLPVANSTRVRPSENQATCGLGGGHVPARGWVSVGRTGRAGPGFEESEPGACRTPSCDLVCRDRYDRGRRT